MSFRGKRELRGCIDIQAGSLEHAGGFTLRDQAGRELPFQDAPGFRSEPGHPCSPGHLRLDMIDADPVIVTYREVDGV
jgi:hypothetical protein